MAKFVIVTRPVWYSSHVYQDCGSGYYMDHNPDPDPDMYSTGLFKYRNEFAYDHKSCFKS